MPEPSEPKSVEAASNDWSAGLDEVCGRSRESKRAKNKFRRVPDNAEPLEIDTGPLPKEISDAIERRVAIYNVHGIGEQLRFETINGITEMIVERFHSEKVQCRIEHLADSMHPLVEVVAGTTQIDIYEAYWAPLTEGQSTLKDSVDFLHDAGMGGLRSTLPWTDISRRFAFNRWFEFPREGWMTWLFLWLLIVIMGLVTINTAILALGAAKSVFAFLPKWPPDGLIFDWNLDVWPLLLMAALAGIAFWFDSLHHNLRLKKADQERKAGRKGLQKEKSGLKPLKRLGTWILIYATLTLIPLTAFAMWYHAAWTQGHPNARLPWWRSHQGVDAIWPGISPALDNLQKFLDAHGFWNGVFGFGLTAVVTASVFVRRMMLQYVGDLAIYLSGHKLTKFFRARESIQDLSCSLASDIYGLQAGDKRSVYMPKTDAGLEFNPYYDEVIVTGHSLGAVIAYDALNSLLKEDELFGGDRNVVGRTTAFVTLGAPLDKTAFLFRVMGQEKHPMREGLAASVQPLIRDYRFRPNCWINLWSNQDPISGGLDFYDDLDDVANQSKWVINIQDPHGDVPFAAHGAYFGNPLFKDVLYNLVMSRCELYERFKREAPDSSPSGPAGVTRSESKRTSQSEPVPPGSPPKS